MVGQTINTYGCPGGSYPITGSDTGMCLSSAGVLSNYNPGTEITPKLVGLYSFTVQLSDGCTIVTKAFTLNIKLNDPTGGMGFTIKNNTGGDAYYMRNSEPCTLWPKLNYINLQTGDSFTVWNKSDCSGNPNKRCKNQTLDTIFFESYDTNSNFCVRWTNNAANSCNFLDDDPTRPAYTCQFN